MPPTIASAAANAATPPTKVPVKVPLPARLSDTQMGSPEKVASLPDLPVLQKRLSPSDVQLQRDENPQPYDLECGGARRHMS